MHTQAQLHGRPTHPRYLPHLDGLRFVLLLGVLLFHFELSPFTGGFIGVDGFLVLSGFLISRNILHSLSTNTFSLRTFYFRRFWRLFPASLVTVALAALFAYLSFPADLANSTARSALSSLLLSSNVYFWREAGYFDDDALRKPLLHMWSLSLEEQFYAFWPVLLVFAVRKGSSSRNVALRTAVLTVSALSIALAFGMHSATPAFVFFMLPCRLYEFGVGAFCALSERIWIRDGPCSRVRVWVEELISFGALMIICGAFIVVPRMHSPVYTLPVAFATAAVIATPESANCRFILGNKVIRCLGKLTYSAYLLHWVLFVFVRYVCSALQLHMPGPGVLMLATFFAAWVLRRIVEEPFRAGGGKYVAVLVLLWVAVWTVCAVGAVTVGWAFRFSGLGVVTGNGRSVVVTYRHLCKDPEYVKRRKYLNTYSDGCRVGVLHGNGTSIVFMGDSYARQLIPALSYIGRATGQYFTFNFMTDCPLMAKRDEFRATRKQQCLDFEDRRWNLLEGRDVPDALPLPRNATIIVAGFGRYSSVDNRRRRLTMLNSDLKVAGHKMMIAGEPPGVAQSEKWRFDCLDIDRTPLMAIIRETTTLSSPSCVGPWMKPKERAAANWEDYQVVMDESLPEVSFIDLFFWLCEEKGTEKVKCQALTENKGSSLLPDIGYARDGHHLTRKGSEYLSNLIHGYLPL